MQVVFKANPELLKLQNKITALQAKVLDDTLTEEDQQSINVLK